MEESASADRLDPIVKRDLFFGDLALTRRQLTQHAAFSLLMMAFLTARLWADSTMLPVPMLALLATWLCTTSALFRVARRRQQRVTSLRPEVKFQGLVGPRALAEMEALAAADPDLASDPRLAVAQRKARLVTTSGRALFVAYLALVAVTFVVVGRGSVADVKAFFRPAPPPTIELVDVILTPWSADFHGAISVDVTGGRVTQIAPYDSLRSSRVEKFRAFEAIGKYLVAGGAIDFSQTGWLDRFKASWMKPIDIGTAADFLVIDVDPRSHDITQDQIAAAVVRGTYFSRQDLRRKGR